MSTSPTLAGKRIAFVVANEGIEQAELEQPWKHLESLGATPVLIATEAGKVQAYNHLDPADTFDATLSTADAAADDYDGVVLPGGVPNGDQLRTDEHAVGFVGAAFAAGIPVAAICHGGWILTEADVVAGRTMTSWPSLRTDLRNAGATWVDREVQVCTEGPNTLVSSRKPDDIPAFNEALVAAVRSYAGG